MTNHNPTAFQRYQAALKAIWDRSGYDRGFISNPFAGDDEAARGLMRTQCVLDALGNPEQHVPLIHVAGSKGKGSTTVLIDAILKASGLRSGRFTSPHLHSYRERFVVDNDPISEEDFASLTERGVTACRKAENTVPDLGSVTAWELSTAMALDWFFRAGCDIAVMEVGLGGTLDATNVIDPLISIITRLDLEHTAILGETLPEIAANKAGIIKPGRPSVTVEQPADALQVLQERAAAVGSRLLVQNRDWRIEGDEDSFAVIGPWGRVGNLRTSLIGQHQVENAGLAVAAVMTAFADNPSFSPEAIPEGLINARHPGRFEIVRRPNQQPIVIDGAHTPVAAESLRAAINKHVPSTHITIVLGMLQDKSPVAFLTPLIGLNADWLVIDLDSPRSLPATTLFDTLTTLNQSVERAVSMEKALDIAVSRSPSDGVIVVTGSLVAVAEARVHLGLGVPDPPPR